ncbi:MAG: hypothetical protein DCC68_00295 [Planctomycetota bacterium]|nr:MAG: hypothetical protein DCC68_00295 [Planctomycetota bacterium]
MDSIHQFNADGRRTGLRKGALCRWVVAFAAAAATWPASRTLGETIVPATYDVDTYMFVGLNTNAEPGLSVSTDYSAGVVANNNAHFIFTVIKFDDLGGLATKAAGGGDKFLRLSTHNFPGPSTIAVSIAKADIDADDGTGYPSPLFPGNGGLQGTNTDRLRWYMANIKGDDPQYGGYAGGAKHVGEFDIPAAGTYQLDVTTAVDAWISGTRPNFGFGVWSVADAGVQGNTFDFASLENPNGNGPALVVTGESSGPAMGDANNDGVVDRRDLVQLMGHYGAASGATWADGDFDGDGAVTLADVVLLKNHFSSPGPPGTLAAAVPEPNGIAACVLGAIGAIALARSRRRPQ